MTTGSPPTDDGGLLMISDEKLQLKAKYPALTRYIRPFIGAREFLHDKVGEFSRYCLWFKDGNPSDYANIPEIKERLLIESSLEKGGTSIKTSDLASGKISMSESIEKIGDTAVETVCGVVESTLQQYGAEAGTMIGGYIGSIFSPVGTAVGAFVGNVIETFAGSKVGQAVTKGVKT